MSAAEHEAAPLLAATQMMGEALEGRMPEVPLDATSVEGLIRLCALLLEDTGDAHQTLESITSAQRLRIMSEGFEG